MNCKCKLYVNRLSKSSFIYHFTLSENGINITNIMNIASHMQENVAVINRVKRHETLPSSKVMLLHADLLDTIMRKGIVYHMQTTKGAGQPAHMGSLVCTFVVLCLQHILQYVCLLLPKISCFYIVSKSCSGLLGPNFTAKLLHDVAKIILM